MENEDNLYLGKDLGDYADLDDVENPERSYQGSRAYYLNEILPDSATILTYRVGSYQGTMGIVITLDDYLWVIKEAYGSCGHCDGYLGAEDKAEYALSICRNAYCFERKTDARDFIQGRKENDDSYYGWTDIVDDLENMVNYIRNP